MSSHLLPRVYTFPFEDKLNKYISISIEAWEMEGYEVRSTEDISWGSIFSRSNNIVVLNWFEDWRLSGKKSPFFLVCRAILQILKFRLLASNMIWVRHNLKPNVRISTPLSRRFIVWILSLFADKIVSHRKLASNKYRIIPHPIYNNENSRIASVSARKIDYLLIGHVRESKNVHRIIEHWPQKKKIVIAGFCQDLSYEKKIRQLASEKKIEMIWTNKILLTEEIDALIGDARFVIYTNDWTGVIVSGLIYHCLSFGTNVITDCGDFPNYIASINPGVHTVEDLRELANFIDSATPRDPHLIYSTLLTTNSFEIFRQKWGELLKT